MNAGERGGVFPPAPCRELIEVFFLSTAEVEVVEASECVDGDRRTLREDRLDCASGTLYVEIGGAAEDTTCDTKPGGSCCGVVFGKDSTDATAIDGLFSSWRSWPVSGIEDILYKYSSIELMMLSSGLQDMTQQRKH